LNPLVYDFPYDALRQRLVDMGEPAFRATQLYQWLYGHRVTSFEAMTNLPKALRRKLAEAFDLAALREVTRQVSKDGTVKFLFGLRDGNAIETVIMRHRYGNSVCVTTQVGCRIGCTFCASTIGGKVRDLTAGEIVAQVVEAQRFLDREGERASHVVVMGIGEPFENYEALMAFLSIINHDKGLNIGQRHITVSTSGIVPRIYDFADAKLQVKLAVSLHAPNDELRSRIMPINRRYPLSELMEACRYYVETTGRRITFEYALLGGVNDRPEHAEELARLVGDLLCHVNLIPVNYVPERRYVRTPRDEIFRFQHILQRHGIPTTVRREHGSDIAAACGQLRAQHNRQKRRETLVERAR